MVQKPGSKRAPAAARIPQASGRVLVVEDNPIAQLLTIQQLRELGYSPSIAGSGNEALEARKTGHFELILLDCRLPDMDGYATARAIRDFEESADRARIAIVAVTADDDVECVDKCLSAGMDGHVRKPTSVAVLREILARHLD